MLCGSVHLRRISESSVEVGFHTAFAVIRYVESAAGAARPSEGANATNQLNVAPHTARAARIARVILSLQETSRTQTLRARLALFKLLGTAARHEDSRGRREIHIFLLGADADASHLAILLLAARRLKLQPVLIVQHYIQLLQEGSERNWRLQTLEKRFAARSIRHFGEIALPVVHLEHIAA